MNYKAVTLRDIAKKLNYSPVTISKALRGHPDISHDTKEKIRKVAEEMGYSPNLMARNLSARKSNTIGLVVPKLAHFFFGAIIEKIYSIAFDNNYEIILTVSQENEQLQQKHIQTLMSMKVDGIIISITQETQDYEIFKLAKQRGFPLVFIDRIPELQNINSVQVKDREGAYEAVEHAINLGYRKIAHFAGRQKINIGIDRYQGFKDAMEANNIPINPDWVIFGGYGDAYGYDALTKLYKENNLPDIIFTVTYPVALGVYAAAKDLNLKIPDDIDIICFGNAKVQKFLSPPLSCVHQPTDLIAEKSMEIMLRKINNPYEEGEDNVQIPTELVLRETCIKYNRK